MARDIEQVYSDIKQKLTMEHLKRITADIINAYKNRNFRYLRRFIPILKIQREIKNNKLFSLLITKFHPDKFVSIMNQTAALYRGDDSEGLGEFYNGYFFSIDSVDAGSGYTAVLKEEYVFNKDDFGYREKSPLEEDNFGESGLDFTEEEYGFLEAVNRYYFGGLDCTLTESDLRKLDGELDLSDYEIHDLKGIEHCTYVNELNLSGNHIEKIGKLSSLINLTSIYLSNNMIEDIEVLRELKKLKTLDISFNNITNIDVLEELDKLEYVNLIGNPVSDYFVVNKLTARGVIVVCEENMLL